MQIDGSKRMDSNGSAFGMGPKFARSHSWGVFRHVGVDNLEASHPGPPEVRIGLVNSAHHDDVHSTLLDDLERDLTPASIVLVSSAAAVDTAGDTSEDSRRRGEAGV